MNQLYNMVAKAVEKPVRGIVTETIPTSVFKGTCAELKKKIYSMLPKEMHFQVMVRNQGGGFDTTIVRLR